MIMNPVRVIKIKVFVKNQVHMKPNKKLTIFLSPYDTEIQQLTIELRNFVTNLIPEANELIWDNYNAVAMAYSKSEKLKDAFCHISVYSKHVNFGFNRGTELTNQLVELKGNGKLIRHLSVIRIDDFPKKDIQKMLWEALGISESNNPELVLKTTEGKSMVMSVSDKKRRP